MGKSFTREDGLMIDSSIIAVDSSGHSLKDAFLHMSAVLDTTTTTSTGFSKTIVDSRINENMRVVNADIANVGNLLTDVNWITYNGQLIFTYNIKANTTATIEFDLFQFTNVVSV